MQLAQGTPLHGGTYRIEKTLGQGSFGITYLATQIANDRKVAIKEFFVKDLCKRDDDTTVVSVRSTDCADLIDKYRKKFIEKSREFSKLTNSNIIKIFDIFEENNTAYYVMEFINGGSLADLIEEKGQLPENEALSHIKNIASALQYLHSKNINHFNIKPSNVLLRQNGDIVLADFGFSGICDSTYNQSTCTYISTSIGYSPIEQSSIGGIGVFSPETDIYSLGATMFNMLTGETPPEAKVIFDNGSPQLPSSISKHIVLAIKKAMAPIRMQRYHSIEEFLTAISESNESTKPKIIIFLMALLLVIISHFFPKVARILDILF